MSTAPENEALVAADEGTKPAFLRRVRIRGYKSIAFCDVTLEPLTVLVGRNASGKSNFLDALAFLRDVMEFNVAEAVKRRGGWQAITSRITEEDSISIKIDIGFPSIVPKPNTDSESALPQPDEWPPMLPVVRASVVGTYTVEIALSQQGLPFVSQESLQIRTEGTNREFGFGFTPELRVEVDPMKPESPVPFAQAYPFRRDRLYLSGIGNQPYIDLANGLRWLGCYNFHPDSIRCLQNLAPGSLLERDGNNLASVIETTREYDQEAIERVGRYLSAITESVELLGVIKYGEYETVRFRVDRNGQGQPLEFDASSMSDGTLRVLASLVAAFQVVLPHGCPSLVAIEEPETSLHPAAMRTLVDALDEATSRTQVLLTTHSAEMLDNPTIRPENVRVVEMIDGQTVISPVDEASAEIVRQKLDTLGGLERQNQLATDPDDLDRQRHLSRNGQEPKA